jgi:hypothetical protein
MTGKEIRARFLGYFTYAGMEYQLLPYGFEGHSQENYGWENIISSNFYFEPETTNHVYMGPGVIFDNTGSSVFELQRIMGADRADYSIPKTPTDLKPWTGVGRVVDGVKDNLGDKFVDVISQPPET